MSDPSKKWYKIGQIPPSRENLFFCISNDPTKLGEPLVGQNVEEERWEMRWRAVWRNLGDGEEVITAKTSWNFVEG